MSNLFALKLSIAPCDIPIDKIKNKQINGTISSFENFKSPSIILIGKVIEYQVSECSPMPAAVSISNISTNQLSEAINYY